MVDWTDWPLLQVSAVEIAAAEVPNVVGAALTEALERGETFAAVVETRRMATGRDRAHGALERVRMVRRLRPGLAAHCRGLAFVVSIESIRANAKAVAAGSRIWGCPTTTVDDLARARAWARDRLGS